MSSFRSIPVEEASQLLAQGGYSYLDVRTPDEFRQGHVQNSVNIPYMLPNPDGEGMLKSDYFLEQVKQKFAQETPLLVGCRSGVRSKKAAEELVQAGYKDVIDVDGGFKAWTTVGYTVAS